MDETTAARIPRRTVLKGALAAAASAEAGLFVKPLEAQTMPLYAYVGSFTTPQRKARGDGINVYRVDAETGGWTHVQKVGGLVNPSFLAVDKQKRFLYAVHADLTEVSAFSINKDDGHITFVNRRSMGGKNPVHLSIDPSGRHLVTANYTGGTVTLLSIEKDGSLGPLLDAVPLEGELGPHRTEQARAQPHDAPFDPSGRFIVVPDKGLDRVFVFKLDAAAGKLVPNDPWSLKTRAGAGPRHVDFHPSLPIAYVNGELDSTVTVCRWDNQRGTLEPKQVITTLPPSFIGNSTTSEIAVAPSGKFVYVSNRGHDSIAIFAVDGASGELAPVDWVSTQGNVPRYFGFDPAGKFLQACNEASDTVVTFRVDAASGKLTPTGQIVKNTSPACVVYAGA